jgi:hypothetical protein
MKHGELSGLLIRPPGCAPSACPGELHRVNGSGERIENDAGPVIDDAMPGEGSAGATSFIWLYRCERCRATLVVAECRDGSGRIWRHQRNEWDPKPLPDHSAENGVADPAIVSPAAIS